MEFSFREQIAPQPKQEGKHDGGSMHKLRVATPFGECSIPYPSSIVCQNPRCVLFRAKGVITRPVGCLIYNTGQIHAAHSEWSRFYTGKSLNNARYIEIVD